MTDFKIKMAELAAKYHIPHKRDIDWHNFVAEVEELCRPELAENEDERIRECIGVALTDVDEQRFKDFGVTLKDCLAYLERQKEQKPAWSEEDEKQIRQIERIVKNAGCTQKLQEQIHDWFKSLRPQPKRDCKDCAMFLNGECTKPRWKPSEEQMKSLAQARDYYMAGKIKLVGGHLAEIYEHLKKL